MAQQYESQVDAQHFAFGKQVDGAGGQDGNGES